MAICFVYTMSTEEHGNKQYKHGNALVFTPVFNTIAVFVIIIKLSISAIKAIVERIYKDS